MIHPRSGQTMVEYGLLLMLVAILVFGALQLVGTNTATTFDQAGSGMQGQNPGGGGGGGGNATPTPIPTNPATFTITTPNPSTGSPVVFDGPSSASSWAWDFGNGSGSSTVENPSYTYPAAGTYVVSLTTNQGSYDLAIDVMAPAPLAANFTTPAHVPPSGNHQVLINTPLQFTDTSTGNPTSWSWTAQANPAVYDYNLEVYTSPATTFTSTAQNPSFTWTTTGTKNVTLTVGDGTTTTSKTQTFQVVRPLNYQVWNDGSTPNDGQINSVGQARGFTINIAGVTNGWASWPVVCNWTFGAQGGQTVTHTGNAQTWVWHTWVTPDPSAEVWAYCEDWTGTFAEVITVVVNP